jgi:hypothetical protein
MVGSREIVERKSREPPSAEKRLAERLLDEAEELVARGDYVQASEKAWGL